MELELGLVLGHHRHHARVVGARRELGEPDLVAPDEKLDAEDTQARAVAGLRESIGDGLGHVLRRADGSLAHGHRLPGFDVVSALLAVTDGCAETRRDRAGGTVPRAYGQQGDLVVEVDPLFDDDDACRGARVFLRVRPGGGCLLGAGDAGLSVPGRRHRGLDEGRVTDLVERGGQFGLAAGEAERAGAHPGQGCGKGADALAVHRCLDGEGVGDDAHAALLVDTQAVGRDRLDLGDDDVDVHGVENLAQGLRVAHVEDAGFVSNLHGGSVGVRVAGDDSASVALQGDCHFLAEFARSEQQNACRQWHGKHRCHGVSSLDDVASLSWIVFARLTPTPLTSAISSTEAWRIRFTEPKCLSSAPWRAGPSPGMESRTERR